MIGQTTKLGWFHKYGPSLEVTDFDGVDDRVEIPSSGLYETSSLKIGFTCIISDRVTYAPLIGNRTSATVSFLLSCYFQNDTIYVQWGNSGGTGITNTQSINVSSIAVEDAMDVYLSFDGDDCVLSVNGVDDTYNRGFNLFNSTQPFTVGYLSGSGYGEALIANVRFGTISTIKGLFDDVSWEDQVGSADGTIYGSPATINTSIVANVGGEEVTEFDGSNDYVEIPSSGLFTVTDFSCEFAILFDDSSATDTYVQSVGANNTISNSFRILRSGVLFYCTLGNTAGNGDGSGITVSTAGFAIGDLITFKVTYDGVNHKFFVNGVEYSQAYTQDMYLPTLPIWVGRWDAPSDRLSKGVIKDLEVGTISTVNGSWNNTTWVDETGTADGTIFGGPPIVRLWE